MSTTMFKVLFLSMFFSEQVCVAKFRPKKDEGTSLLGPSRASDGGGKIIGVSSTSASSRALPGQRQSGEATGQQRQTGTATYAHPPREVVGQPYHLVNDPIRHESSHSETGQKQTAQKHFALDDPDFTGDPFKDFGHPASILEGFCDPDQICGKGQGIFGPRHEGLGSRHVANGTTGASLIPKKSSPDTQKNENGAVIYKEEDEQREQQGQGSTSWLEWPCCCRKPMGYTGYDRKPMSYTASSLAECAGCGNSTGQVQEHCSEGVSGNSSHDPAHMRRMGMEDGVNLLNSGNSIVFSTKSSKIGFSCPMMCCYGNNTGDGYGTGKGSDDGHRGSTRTESVRAHTSIDDLHVNAHKSAYTKYENVPGGLRRVRSFDGKLRGIHEGRLECTPSSGLSSQDARDFSRTSERTENSFTSSGQITSPVCVRGIGSTGIKKERQTTTCTTLRHKLRRTISKAITKGGKSDDSKSDLKMSETLNLDYIGRPNNITLVNRSSGLQRLPSGNRSRHNLGTLPPSSTMYSLPGSLSALHASTVSTKKRSVWQAKVFKDDVMRFEQYKEDYHNRLLEDDIEEEMIGTDRDGGDISAIESNIGIHLQIVDTLWDMMDEFGNNGIGDKVNKVAKEVGNKLNNNLHKIGDAVIGFGDDVMQQINHHRRALQNGLGIHQFMNGGGHGATGIDNFRAGFGFLGRDKAPPPIETKRKPSSIITVFPPPLARIGDFSRYMPSKRLNELVVDVNPTGEISEHSDGKNGGTASFSADHGHTSGSTNTEDRPHGVSARDARKNTMQSDYALALLSRDMRCALFGAGTARNTVLETFAEMRSQSYNHFFELSQISEALLTRPSPFRTIVPLTTFSDLRTNARRVGASLGESMDALNLEGAMDLDIESTMDGKRCVVNATRMPMNATCVTADDGMSVSRTALSDRAKPLAKICPDEPRGCVPRICNRGEVGCVPRVCTPRQPICYSEEETKILVPDCPSGLSLRLTINKNHLKEENESFQIPLKSLLNRVEHLLRRLNRRKDLLTFFNIPLIGQIHCGLEGTFRNVLLNVFGDGQQSYRYGRDGRTKHIANSGTIGSGAAGKMISIENYHELGAIEFLDSLKCGSSSLIPETMKDDIFFRCVILVVDTSASVHHHVVEEFEVEGLSTTNSAGEYTTTTKYPSDHDRSTVLRLAFIPQLNFKIDVGNGFLNLIQRFLLRNFAEKVQIPLRQAFYKVLASLRGDWIIQSPEWNAYWQECLVLNYLPHPKLEDFLTTSWEHSIKAHLAEENQITTRGKNGKQQGGVVESSFVAKWNTAETEEENAEKLREKAEIHAVHHYAHDAARIGNP